MPGEDVVESIAAIPKKTNKVIIKKPGKNSRSCEPGL
jgi:hypothetical protein